ncbi:MAG: aminoglycoside phosphotransferase family protein [Planctomycetales bacterium]|nr:aminoglycoside phosphotransferase family protein [Planctomycetales bacterium]
MKNTPTDSDSRLLTQLTGRALTATHLRDGDHVIKLFHVAVPAAVAHREAAIVRTVSAAGVRTPAVHEVFTHNGAPAIRFERCPGTSLLDCLLGDTTQVSAHAQRFAAAHVKLHAMKADDLPDLAAVLETAIAQSAGRVSTSADDHGKRFPPGPHWLDAQILNRQETEPIQEAVNVERISGADTICHNDFQPANLLIDAHETWILNWLNATRGAALADVAQTSLLLRFAPLTVQHRERLPKKWLDIEDLRRQFHDEYLQTYYRLAPFSTRELAAWIKVRAMAWPASFPQPYCDDDQPWGDIQFE